MSGDETFRRNIVSKIRTEVLKDICDGRWENLGRLGAIVPFVPLDVLGRAEVITRQARQSCCIHYCCSACIALCHSFLYIACMTR